MRYVSDNRFPVKSLPEQQGNEILTTCDYNYGGGMARYLRFMPYMLHDITHSDTKQHSPLLICAVQTIDIILCHDSISLKH